MFIPFFFTYSNVTFFHAFRKLFSKYTDTKGKNCNISCAIFSPFIVDKPSSDLLDWYADLFYEHFFSMNSTLQVVLFPRKIWKVAETFTKDWKILCNVWGGKKSFKRTRNTLKKSGFFLWGNANHTVFSI